MKEIRYVLAIYVGGTIGMQKNENGVYVPLPNAFYNKVKSNSGMHDPELAKEYQEHMKENQLILPKVGPKMVVYEIKEYNPLLDSSNMTVQDWISIANDIKLYYPAYDGFVVLHGTDTLAYTSSALSFMLENLEKPVIITGSQIPVFETRSDAKENFLSSLIFAGCYNIPEVCVFFAHKLLRGNRTTKISSNQLNAFDSPNYHRLADAHIDVMIHDHYIRHKNHQNKDQFKVHNKLNYNVGNVIFFPTITADQLESFLKPPIEGVVLQSYGAGNIPSNRSDLLGVLKKAIDNGVVILNVTQCPMGMVNATYETGMAMEKLGIISGNDMTAEAALTKLAFVLGMEDTYESRVKMMKTNLRGEITENNNISFFC